MTLDAFLALCVVYDFRFAYIEPRFRYDGPVRVFFTHQLQ